MKYGKRIVMFSLFAMNLVEQPTPVIEIEQGKLSGVVSADGTILEYLGVPYATVNDTNRFRAPFPAPSWTGIFKANEEYACPQYFNGIGVLGTEDCLRTNVYVPVKATTPLPVMIYIPGGAFVVGSGGKIPYGPGFLLKKDVILVTVNYRLGVLGFLCLGIEAAPGNAGLKDQIAALRWVKKNIAAFGGDPDNITLFGESAGGTSTSLLIASEATDGLFHKAIVQSGTSLSNWAVNRNPVWIASQTAKELGYNTEDPQEIYELLSKIPYKELITIKPKKPIEVFYDTYLLHLPCVEKSFPGEEPAISDLPHSLLIKKHKNIPVIYGSNSREGLFLMPDMTEDVVEERNEKYLPVYTSDLEFPSDDVAIEINKMIKLYYFGEGKITRAQLKQVSEMFTHLYFEIPEILETEIVLESSKAPVFNYIFNYSGERNFPKYISGYGNDTGACHGDEILYLFDGLWPFSISQNDRKIIDWMTTMWTNFAKFGHPTPPLSNDLPINWIPSTKEELKFLYIEDNLRIGSMPNPEAYDLWSNVYNKYRRKNLTMY